MSIEYDGKIIRSLPEQVAENLSDILQLASDLNSLTVLVNSKLTGAMHYKGSVTNVADLPATGNEVGDFYNETSTGSNYAWDGTQWDLIGSIVDLSNYYTKSESNSRYVALTGDQTIQGSKTFNNILKVANAITSTESIFYLGTQNIARIGMNSQTIFPVFTGTLSLGGSSNKWGDLYLKGIAYISTIEDRNTISFKINGVERFKLNGADAITGRLYPSIGNTFNIGTSSLKYKDLHLSGGFNPNASGYKLTLPDTSALTADSEVITSYGIQNIYQTKTFKTTIKFENNNQVFTFGASGGSEFYTFSLVNGTVNGNLLYVENNLLYSRMDFLSRNDNGKDLGSNAYRWRDLFLGRNLSDGTNSVTVADLAALITYAKAQGWIS